MTMGVGMMVPTCDGREMTGPYNIHCLFHAIHFIVFGSGWFCSAFSGAWLSGRAKDKQGPVREEKKRLTVPFSFEVALGTGQDGRERN